MSARGVTMRGRRAAERLMVDRCDISRPGSGTPVTDPETGEVTVPREAVYTGRCRVQTRRPYPSNPEAGEHAWTTVVLEVHLPVSATGIRVGDTVTVTDSFDPGNVGRTFRVRSDDRKTYQTALRLLVEEVTG